MKNKRLFYFLRLFVLLLVLLQGLQPMVFGQSSDIQVKGVVTDESKQPVIGANIIVKGTSIGTATDANGQFTLKVPRRESVLVISFLGFNTQEITVGQKISFDITLAESGKNLETVVVIAYGTQTKATITGALSSIDSKELIKAPVADITNILAGQMPGVTTIQTTGQPGADGAQIFIRGVSSLTNGTSSPLILVDGVERPMSSIDPNEIENLSILKDASSTAVFGVRGANGVILVTTRRGNVGKPVISFSSITGIQQPMSYVERAGSYEYAKFWNMKQQLDNVTDPKMFFTREAIEAYRIGSDPIMYPNVDWGEKMFNDVFMQTKNNINISGGNEKVRYFISLGMFYQNGVLKQLPNQTYDNNYRYNRYNFRTNLDFKLTSTTNMKFNIGGVMGKSQEPRVIEDVKYGWTYAKIWAVPMSSPGMINGMRTFVPKSMVPNLEMRDGFGAFYGWGYNEYYRNSLNIDAEVTQSLDILTKGLSISAKGSFDSKMNMNKYRKGNGMETQTVYYKSHLADSSLPTTDPDYDKTYVYIPKGADTPLVYSDDTGRDRNWYLEFRMNYNRTFGDGHNVSALVLYNQSRDYYPVTPSGSAADFLYIPRSYVGLVGRATYGYKSKYLADFSVGYNGSENFAPGKTRYGFFPSVSVGYVLTSEEFMKNQKIVDYFKLRASAGKVGSDLGASTRFMYMQSVWNPGGEYSFGTNNPNGTEYYLAGTPGNPQVTWETAVKYNFGLDMSFLKDRLSVSADYFTENRTGILIAPKSTPSIIATKLPNLNIGEVDNHGYEISLGWKESYKSSFSYAINANVSFARNQIIYMDEVRSKFDYQNQTGGSTGRQTEIYKYVRLYQQSDFVKNSSGQLVLNPSLPQPVGAVYPGDAMYADLSGNGIVDGDDKMVDGYSTRPEYVFGLNTQFNYKGFNLNMNWIGATNVQKMLSVEYRIPFTNAGGRGLLQYLYDDCWTPQNQNGKYPRPAMNSQKWNSENSTLWLMDASYIRLKSVTFGYTFTSKKALEKIGISSLGISFTGYNILTFSPMKFEDPETVADINGQYPLVKTYNLGININF